MSCWVVPSLAADVWRIPLDQVWRRIRDGQIPTLQENGFTFVDVAPYGRRVERPILPPAERPSTFEPVDATSEPEGIEPSPAAEVTPAAELPPTSETARVIDEEAALLGAVEPSAEDPPQERSDEDEMGPPDETGSETLGDWRSARRRNARLRVPPLKWRMTA